MRYPLRVTYNDMEGLQRAREDFEELMNDHTLNCRVDDHVPSAPILTSAGRHRRELEIELLESLRHTDDAVDELMHLWMCEHTAEEAATLEAMEQSCSSGLVREERELRRMIDENPHWAEPRVRLAALYFFKGETDESYRTALEAQKIKPWHFEIVPLLIMLSLRQEDMSQALFWARSGLPHLRDGRPPSKRRREWVDRAVAKAREQWEEAERATEAFLSGNANHNDDASAGSKKEEMWQ